MTRVTSHALPTPAPVIRLAVAWLLLAPVAVRSADTVVVRIALRTEVDVTGRLVRLGDVAAIDALDPPTLERLAALSIGPAPATGSTVRLRREQLLGWIRARTGLRAEQVVFSGAAEVTVRVAVKVVSGTAIAGRALEALTAAIGESKLRGEIHPAAPPRDVEVPAGTLELRARPVPRAVLLSRRPSVWIDLSVDGRFIRTVPVAFDLVVYGPGLVATDRQLPGDLLDRNAVEVREVPWTSSDVLPVEQREAPLRLRHPVEPGVTLTRAHVEAAPQVRRGGYATLRVGDGLVSLESRVQVLEDGRPGQTVHVKPSGADGPVLARVTGPGIVEVVP